MFRLDRAHKANQKNNSPYSACALEVLSRYLHPVVSSPASNLPRKTSLQSAALTQQRDGAAPASGAVVPGIKLGRRLGWSVRYEGDVKLVDVPGTDGAVELWSERIRDTSELWTSAGTEEDADEKQAAEALILAGGVRPPPRPATMRA